MHRPSCPPGLAERDSPDIDKPHSHDRSRSAALLSFYLFKLLIDDVALIRASDETTAAVSKVLLLTGLAGVTAVAYSVCRTVTGLVVELQAHAVADRVQDMLNAKSFEVDLEYYETPQYYDTLHRAQEEASIRPLRIVYGLEQVFQSGIGLLVVVILLSRFHVGLALVLFAAVIPPIVTRLRYAEEIYEARRRQTSTERLVRYVDTELTDGRHAQEVRLFDLGHFLRRRSRELRRRLRRERLELAPAAQLQNSQRTLSRTS